MALKELLNEILDKLEFKGNFKIKVKPLRRKIASISHRTKTIYINKTCLEILSNEEIKFVIAHELLHLKYGKFHTLNFETNLKLVFNKDLTYVINEKLIKNHLGPYFNNFGGYSNR